MTTYQTFSSRETKFLGKKIAQELIKKSKKRRKIKEALVFALKGDLGSGKTTFIQGFIQGLGLKKRSPSPTFILFRRFPIFRCAEFSNCYHIDAYRLKKPNEFLKLGFKKIIKDNQNIVLIEWADKIKKYLPADVIWLSFDFGEQENERKIKINK